MHKISARQHFIPGLLDLSEDEAPSERRLDALTVFVAVLLALGLLLLVFFL